MRLFPRTARRRWAGAVIICALTAGALSVPLANADDLKDKQKQVEKEIRQAHSALEDSSAQLQRAHAAVQRAKASLSVAKRELVTARTKLEAARIRDQVMEDRLEVAVARLEQAEEDVETGRAAVEDQRLELTDVVTSIYREGDPGLMALTSFLEMQSTEDLTRRAEMQDVVVNREDNAYDDLRAAEVLLEVREQQVSEARDEVAVQRQEAAEHLVTMRDLRDRAKAAKLKVRELVKDRRQAKKQAVKARKHDRALLAKLKQREQKIKEMILRRARNAGGGWTGATDGFLNRPVPGYVTSPFGYRVHPIYGYYGLHNGTDFHAPCGTSLHAVAGGRVIARYWSSVYGNRLYIGIGNVNGRYLTAVYNHARGYRVDVGDRVSRGQVIGTSGSTGWSTACHLHFTVLRGGKPVNPMNYM